MLWCWLLQTLLLAVIVLKSSSEELIQPDQLTLSSNYTTLTVKKCNWTIGTEAILVTRCYCYMWKGAEKCTIPGPTLVFTNGSNGYVRINNSLDGHRAVHIVDIVESLVSHDPDVTNLHTHGLHVNPIVDDIVDILIEPGDSKDYPFYIVPDHYPGLHWYHAHWHGSVVFQVHGGMVGAMFVNREDNKGIDTSLANMKSKLVIIHSLHLTNKTNNNHLLNSDGTCNCTNYTDWFDVGDSHASVSLTLFHLTTVCDQWCDMLCFQRHRSDTQPQQIISDDSYANSDIFINIPQTNNQPWEQGMSAFLVNGQYRPTITISSKEWLRLRILIADAQGSYILHFDANSSCEYYYIAADGIFFNSARNLSSSPYDHHLYVSMAGRAEIVLRCNNTGYYAVKHANQHPNSTINATIQHNPIYNVNLILFYINVTSNVSSSSFDPLTVTFPPHVGYINDTLSATHYYTQGNCTNYSKPDGSKNSTIIWQVFPHPNNNCSKETLNVTLNYSNIGFTLPLNLTGQIFGINGQYFRHDFPLAILEENQIYQMQILFGPHPFHHHINPYQLMRDVGYGFLGMKGEWRDVLSSANDFKDLFVRTRTNDFTGKVIMHCHFLPHEDRGLMGYYTISNASKLTCSSGRGKSPVAGHECNVPRGNDELCELFSNDVNTTTTTTTTASTKQPSNANLIGIQYYFYWMIVLLIFVVLL